MSEWFGLEDFRLEPALHPTLGTITPNTAFGRMAGNWPLLEILKWDEFYSIFRVSLKYFQSDWGDVSRECCGFGCSCPWLCHFGVPAEVGDKALGAGSSSWSHSIISELPSSPQVWQQPVLYKQLPPNSHQFWVLWSSIIALISVDFGEMWVHVCFSPSAPYSWWSDV